jgi:hypothetical protein
LDADKRLVKVPCITGLRSPGGDVHNFALSSQSLSAQIGGE